MVASGEDRTPNVQLCTLRDDAGLSQQELAAELNNLATRKFGKYADITKKTIGRWERGEVEWPQPFYRRLLAEYFSCAVDELGFRRPQRAVTAPPATSSDEMLTLVASPGTADPRVQQDQELWRTTRSTLGGHRRALAVAAQELYPDAQVPGLERTGVIALPSWIPEEPVPLGAVVLDLDSQPNPPALSGSERESAQVRPSAGIS